MQYIIFPPTDVNDQSQLLYNGPSQLTVQSATIIRAGINELATKYAFTPTLDYLFDNRFRIIGVLPTDDFVITRNEIVQQGTLKSIDWTEYLSELTLAVKYWTDSGWVTEGQLRAAGL